jgi:GTP cyclohydrolase I
MDRRRLEEATRMLIEAMGDSAAAEDVRETPARVAEMWEQDLLSGYASDPQAELTWEPAAGERSLVLVRDIEFTSVCMHHLLPFTGRAAVAYLPEDRLCGLSKLVRLVDCLSRRLQMQERLTSAIVDAIVSALRPRGAACLVTAVHGCMSCRGVRQPGASVVTLRLAGDFERPEARSEIVALMGKMS